MRAEVFRRPLALLALVGTVLSAVTAGSEVSSAWVARVDASPRAAPATSELVDEPVTITLADTLAGTVADAPADAPTAPPAPEAAVSVAPTAPATAPNRAPLATPAPSGALARGGNCPADWFCYPRLSIAGPIVAYSDCRGATDIGTSIRAFTCLSPNYLLGHAYTQFGRITQWQAGDVVYARGRSFTITGALTARSCGPPPLPLAPLSLQTSLSASSCGPTLVVQAH